MKKSLFSILFLVSACGYDFGLEDKNIENSEIERQKTRLERLGVQVQGVYSGSLEHVDGNNYQVEVRLFYVNEVQGQDENGDIYTLPRLKGQLRYENLFYSNEERVFNVRYDERGEFSMLLPESGDTIIGSWESARIIAEWDQNGFVGKLDVERLSKVVSQIEEPERRSRMRRQFSQIKGVYQGELIKIGETKKFDDVSISFDYYPGLKDSPLIASISTMETSYLFVGFSRVPVQWDPRTGIFDIDFTPDRQGNERRILISGVLSSDGMDVESFRFVSQAFDFISKAK
ncbi:MAG: hypothetical protein AB8E15_06755 [Bdellovibrionales bacterium]